MMTRADFDQPPFLAAAQPPTPDAFGAVSDNAVLRERLRSLIRQEGRISFARFMDTALYDPEEGYYARRAPIGRRGDYLTSPEVHPLFGALVCRQLVEMWQLLQKPAPFHVVEMGAGTGTLARSILSATHGHEIESAMRYEVVEPLALQRRLQRETLGSLANRVSWSLSLEDGGVRPVACLLSNELPDSFAVHRVTVQAGILREVYVALQGERFVDVAGEPSTSALEEYFSRLGMLPGKGCTAEVNLAAAAWMQAVASSLVLGFVLTLDYGYPARELFAPWRREGTLLCFYQHSVSSDPYERVGRQDITTHVDYTTLARAGEASGLTTLGFTTQSRFLDALGAADALAGGLEGVGGLEEYLARRRAIEALLDPEGLGRVRVLLQGRGVGRPQLRGFGGADGTLP